MTHLSAVNTPNDKFDGKKKIESEIEVTCESCVIFRHLSGSWSIAVEWKNRARCRHYRTAFSSMCIIGFQVNATHSRNISFSVKKTECYAMHGKFLSAL